MQLFSFLVMRCKLLLLCGVNLDYVINVVICHQSKPHDVKYLPAFATIEDVSNFYEKI